MPRFDNVACEPFRTWNRLEPRSRTDEFDQVLQVGVHDALWMLTRQWQFGEFAGEDTGSAIFAKMQLNFTQLSHYRALNGQPAPYNDTNAFEQKIERMPAPLNDKVRLQAGQLFLRILVQQAEGFAGLPVFDRAAYSAKLRTLWPLAKVPSVNPQSDVDTIVNQVKAQTNIERSQFLSFFGPSAFDGIAIYQQSQANLNQTAQKIKLAPTHSYVNSALKEFMLTMQRTFVDELEPTSDAWNPRQLEYQFKCLLPDDNNNQKIVLTAEEYFSGQLDWYSFDVDSTPNGLDAFVNTSPQTSLLSSKTLTVIPTEARFSGMPNSRWWQFEEGEVDLGNVRSDTTDLARLIFSEYALLYGNNFLMVPITVPVGTLAEVKGIVVTDVFGERQLVQPTNQGETDNWTSWGMFNLTTRHADGNRQQPADTRLWIPPVTIKTLESEPIEHVHLLRDEMANMVWAIETKIENGLGRSLDGHTFAVALQNKLEKLDTPSELVTDQTASLQYILANKVPENWIPFIPVHQPDQNRSVQLQRASMPRWFKASYRPVRPQTELLKAGLTQQPVAPYFINEEEVSRTGIQIINSYQRTRWYNGKTIDWYGYRKLVGRGEGSSGLQFDRLEPLKKS